MSPLGPFSRLSELVGLKLKWSLLSKKTDSSAGRIQHGDAVRTDTEAKILQPVNCPNRFSSLNWLNRLNGLNRPNRLNGPNRCNVLEAAVEG